jgi:hypothetical protein
MGLGLGEMSHRAHIVMVGMSQMTDEERSGQERVNFQAWQCSFLPGFFLLIAVLPAQSQQVPVLNVEPVYRGIAQQASDPSEKGGPDLPFSQCIKSAQAMRQRLVEGQQASILHDQRAVGGFQDQARVPRRLEMG